MAELVGERGVVLILNFIYISILGGEAFFLRHKASSEATFRLVSLLVSEPMLSLSS